MFQVSAFDLNEELKERCILLGASRCFTQYVEDPQYKNAPFWFNAVELPNHMHKNYVMVVCGLIDNYLEEIGFLGIEDQGTDVSVRPEGRYVVYCFFTDKQKFYESVKI